MQLRHTLRLLVDQVGAQDVGEEVMVAVPAAAVVEVDDEDVAPLQRFEHRLTALVAGDRVAQRAAQRVEDRLLQQELADTRGLALQHLLDQVVDDVAIVPGSRR